jgi:hypothetical protein
MIYPAKCKSCSKDIIADDGKETCFDCLLREAQDRAHSSDAMVEMFGDDALFLDEEMGDK